MALAEVEQQGLGPIEALRVVDGLASVRMDTCRALFSAKTGILSFKAPINFSSWMLER